MTNELHVAGCRGAWGSVVFQTWSPPCLLTTSCLNAEAESDWGRDLVTKDRMDARDSRTGSSRLSPVLPLIAPPASSASDLVLQEVNLLSGQMPAAGCAQKGAETEDIGCRVHQKKASWLCSASVGIRSLSGRALQLGSDIYHLFPASRSCEVHPPTS